MGRLTSKASETVSYESIGVDPRPANGLGLLAFKGHEDKNIATTKAKNTRRKSNAKGHE